MVSNGGRVPTSVLYPVLGSFLGWMMDGYVTISYLIQAQTITPLFFPGQLWIVYYFLFVVNGVARAFGALYLGNYIGDKIGRKRMVVITILAFSFSSFTLGLLPTYSQIGVAAPISMGVLLFLMGLFAGAEYGGGTALSMESVPQSKRNLLGAFVQSGFGVGYAILGFVYFILTKMVFPTNYDVFGWRVLFYTTIVPGIAAFGIRYMIPESEVFTEARRKGQISSFPFASLLKEKWKGVILILGITGGLLFVNTATFSLYPTILQGPNGFSMSASGFWIAIINLISIAGVILGGSFARSSLERLKFILRYSVIFFIINFVVVFFAFSKNLTAVVIAFSVQAFFEAMIFSTIPAFMAESFSKRYRTTGVGFVYNAGATIGTTALVLIPGYASIYGWPTVWMISISAAMGIMIVSLLIYRSRVAVAAPMGDAIVD